MLFPNIYSRNRYQTTGYHQWARLVKIKNGYRCQKCGDYSRSIHAHHIKNYNSFPKGRILLSNGITLCRSCHYSFHIKYGFYRNNAKQLEDFLKNP